MKNRSMSSQSMMKLIFAIICGAALINLIRKGVGFEQLLYLTPILIVVCALIAVRGE